MSAKPTKMNPFRADPTFPDKIRKGIKTETRRSIGYVQKIGGLVVGEIVGTDFGTDIKILEVRKERLGDISLESIRAEGCKDLEEFMVV